MENVSYILQNTTPFQQNKKTCWWKIWRNEPNWCQLQKNHNFNKNLIEITNRDDMPLLLAQNALLTKLHSNKQYASEYSSWQNGFYRKISHNPSLYQSLQENSSEQTYFLLDEIMSVLHITLLDCSLLTHHLKLTSNHNTMHSRLN